MVGLTYTQAPADTLFPTAFTSTTTMSDQPPVSESPLEKSTSVTSATPEISEHKAEQSNAPEPQPSSENSHHPKRPRSPDSTDLAELKNAKRIFAEEPDYIQSLSRRESPAAAAPKSSVYKEAKPIPAWMKSKAQAKEEDKYAKYGGRRDAKPEEDKYARYSAQDDRYSKYGATPRASSDSRVIRRDPEPKSAKTEIATEDTADKMAEGAAAPYTSIPSVGGMGLSSEYRTFLSSITHKENRDINSIVRQHYNQRTFQSKVQGSRTKSPIYKLRNFNNAIKYILLGNFVKRRQEGAPLVLMDFCCGKGGDLNKCEFVHVDQYIGVDISDASVREAYSRYSQNKARFIPQNPNSKRNRDSRRYNFDACLATGDLFSHPLPEILEPNFPGIMDGLFPVDAVSVQFSFHYAWETESKVRMVLSNITKSLRPGGTFIGTMPSSDFIREKIVKKDFNGERSFGNSLYRVRFEEDPPEDGVFRSPFGNKYDYYLKDAVDDVPEYVVPFEYFRLLCEDYGLILKYKKNFIDIFNLEIPKYFSQLNKNLVDGMKRADGKYGVEGDEKEAVEFYIGFVFEKLGN